MRFLLLLSASALCFAAEDPVEYGKYLTLEVGKCQTCHSGLGDDGKLDPAKHLKGQVLNIQPIKPIEGWHKTAPDITPGSRLWERWGEAGIRNFMITGKNPKGGPADAPMPTYHLKPADADAMIAYLKTLK